MEILKQIKEAHDIMRLSECVQRMADVENYDERLLMMFSSHEPIHWFIDFGQCTAFDDLDLGWILEWLEHRIDGVTR